MRRNVQTIWIIKVGYLIQRPFFNIRDESWHVKQLLKFTKLPPGHVPHGN
jgi:hypothetical protein